MHLLPESVTLSGAAATGAAVLLVLLVGMLSWLMVQRRRLAARAAALQQRALDAGDAEEAAAQAAERARREADDTRSGAEAARTDAALARRLLAAAREIGAVAADDTASAAQEIAARVEAALGVASAVSLGPWEGPDESEDALFVPLRHGAATLGTLEVRSAPPIAPEVLDALATVASAALAAARAREDVHRAEQALAQADELRRRIEDELRDELRSRDEFLATVAHELRTPLNALVGWSHILRSGTADATTRERAVDAILRNGDRQSRLISDLLDLARVTSGQLRIEPQRGVEMAPVVRGAMETVRPAAESKGIRLSSIVDAEAGPLVADPNRLQQVVWNLLVNAVKFTPRGGEIALEVGRASDGVEIKISDTGPGIPEDVLPHVFDRFRQAGSARRQGGLGLGLAIVRHLVELHGGSVSVENRAPGTGTTFVVHLPFQAPVREPREAEAAAVADLDLLPSLEGLRVLVFSPEDETRELLVSILGGRGAQTDVASASDDVLAEMKRSSPDLLVSDLDGPDGYELVRQVRGLPASEGGAVVAVALSAPTDPGARVRALLAGYQGHLVKPVDPAELVALAARLSDRVRMPLPAL